MTYKAPLIKEVIIWLILLISCTYGLPDELSPLSANLKIWLDASSTDDIIKDGSNRVSQ